MSMKRRSASAKDLLAFGPLDIKSQEWQMREDTDNPLHREEAELAASTLLCHIGEDPDRDGLRETPARMVKALRELTAGYEMDPHAILSKRFDVKHDEMVVVKRIPYWSLCEHHVLPFYGTVDVAYLPGNEVVGLSKIPRLVECFARRLQVQERMTEQIAHTLLGELKCQGVGVVVRGNHLCMQMRGVQKTGTMTTSCLLGRFREEDAMRAEFLALARNGDG